MISSKALAIGGIVAAATLGVAGTASAHAPATGPDHSGPLGPLVTLGVLTALSALAWWVLRRTDTLRPGSLDRARRADPPLTGEPVLPLLLLTFGVFLTPQFLGGAVFAATGISPEPGSLTSAGQTAAAIYGPAIVVCVVALVLARRARLLPVGRLRCSPRIILIGLASFVLAAPLVWAVGALVQLGIRLFGDAPGSSIQHGTLDTLTAPGAADNPWWWAVLAGAVLGAPIFEEVVFRGFMQPAIAGVARSRWAGIVVTSAVFTLMHVPTGSENSGATWLAIPTLLAISLAMGIALERTGRLWVPIVMHIVFNAANVALAFAVSPG